MSKWPHSVVFHDNGLDYAKKKTPVKQGSNPHGSAGYYLSGYIFSNNRSTLAR